MTIVGGAATAGALIADYLNRPRLVTDAPPCRKGALVYAGRRHAARAPVEEPTGSRGRARATARICCSGHAAYRRCRRGRLHAGRAASIPGPAAVHRFPVHPDATV